MNPSLNLSDSLSKVICIIYIQNNTHASKSEFYWYCTNLYIVKVQAALTAWRYPTAKHKKNIHAFPPKFSSFISFSNTSPGFSANFMTFPGFLWSCKLS